MADLGAANDPQKVSINMRTARDKRLINGMITATGGVLAIVVLSIWQYRRIQDTGTTIRHANQVLFQTDKVLNAVMQYQLNVKNYLLTGSKRTPDGAADLGSDSVAVGHGSNNLLDTAGISSSLSALKTLTADNPGQQLRIDTLSWYTEKDRAVLAQAVQLKRSGRMAEMASLMAVEATTGCFNQIQTIIAAIQAEERRLLDFRRQLNQRKALELQCVLWSLIAVVVFLALVIFRWIQLDLGREKIARERLGRFNQELEREVQLKTASLQASEEKYKTLFYKSPLPKWIYDEMTLQFLEVNEAAVRIYGYNQEQFQQMTIMDIRPEEDKPRLAADVEEVRRHPGIYMEGQWRHIKQDGEVIDVEIIAHPIDFSGRKARMVVANDITDRTRYETEMRRLNDDLGRRADELAASNAELERFAYIASHDLQEPLRMVSSFLQLLQKKYSGQMDAKADQYIHYAVDGAERMKALIMDLLEYSRVGTGKEGFGWVDTAAVMSEVGEIFREKIVTARARIEIGELPTVWGDKVQLAQLLQNLVSNALKYHSNRQPVIRIRAEGEDGHWLFTVEDNGIGIDPLFFEKIFIIFQRLHNRNDYSGTGIGLAVCKKIVERHGGKIWVESDQRSGSTFFFTINKKS
jgi:PAS domain S-box-containing protein